MSSISHSHYSDMQPTVNALRMSPLYNGYEGRPSAPTHKIHRRGSHTTGSRSNTVTKIINTTTIVDRRPSYPRHTHQEPHGRKYSTLDHAHHRIAPHSRKNTVEYTPPTNKSTSPQVVVCHHHYGSVRQSPCEESKREPAIFTAPSVSSHASSCDCRGKIQYVKIEQPRRSSGTTSIDVDISGNPVTYHKRTTTSSSSSSSSPVRKMTSKSNHTTSTSSSSSSSSSSSRKVVTSSSSSKVVNTSSKATPYKSRSKSSSRSVKDQHKTAGLRTEPKPAPRIKKSQLLTEDNIEFGTLKPKFCFIGPRSTNRKVFGTRWACGHGGDMDYGNFSMRSAKYLNKHKRKL